MPEDEQPIFVPAARKNLYLTAVSLQAGPFYLIEPGSTSILAISRALGNG